MHQRRNPLEANDTKNPRAIFRADRPLLGNGRDLLQPEGVQPPGPFALEPRVDEVAVLFLERAF